MKKVCIFCGKSAPEVKMSNEHVIRSHLSSFLRDVPTATQWEQTYLSAEGGGLKNRIMKIPASPLQATSNDVCKTCNEGWLNLKVEIPVEKVLGKLIQGARQRIDNEAANRISTWAAKTSMVRARLDKPPYPIPQEHHAYLMNTLTPPEGTFVWLGHSEYDSGSFTRHYKFMSFDNWGSLQIGHLTTIIIGHMAIYVFGCSGQHAGIYYGSFVELMDGYDLLRLHPNGNSSFWPRALPMRRDYARSLSSALVNFMGFKDSKGSYHIEN